VHQKKKHEEYKPDNNGSDDEQSLRGSEAEGEAEAEDESVVADLAC